jgi:hypothetical protein
MELTVNVEISLNQAVTAFLEKLIGNSSVPAQIPAPGMGVHTQGQVIPLQGETTPPETATQASDATPGIDPYKIPLKQRYAGEQGKQEREAIIAELTRKQIPFKVKDGTRVLLDLLLGSVPQQGTDHLQTEVDNTAAAASAHNITVDEIRNLLGALYLEIPAGPQQDAGRAMARKILADNGAASVSDLAVESYPAVKQACLGGAA